VVGELSEALFDPDVFGVLVGHELVIGAGGLELLIDPGADLGKEPAIFDAGDGVGCVDGLGLGLGAGGGSTLEAALVGARGGRVVDVHGIHLAHII